MREHHAVLYAATSCVTQTRLYASSEGISLRRLPTNRICTRPGRLVKFTTRLVVPQIVATTTQAVTYFQSEGTLWQCVPQAH